MTKPTIATSNVVALDDKARAVHAYAQASISAPMQGQKHHKAIRSISPGAAET